MSAEKEEEEVWVWRAVVRALQAEFHLTDDRIREMYEAASGKTLLPPPPPQLSAAKSTPPPCCQLLDRLSNDVLGLVCEYLEVHDNMQLRRVCARFAELSTSREMTRYWTAARARFTGAAPSPWLLPSSSSSPVFWEREYKWAGRLGGKPTVITTLSGHRGTVTSLAFVPPTTTTAEGGSSRASAGGGELLVSGSHDGSLVVWSITSNGNSGGGGGDGGGENDDAAAPRLMQQHHRQSKPNSVVRLHSLNGHHGAVWSASVNANGHVASGSLDKTVKLWDLHTGNCLHTLRGHEHWVGTVHLGSDGVLISGGLDARVKVWRLDANDPAAVQPSRPVDLPVGLGDDGGNVNNSVWCVDRCDAFVAAGSSLSRFEVFDLGTGQLVTSRTGAHAAKTYAVHFQSPGILATGGCDGKAKVWDLREKNSPSAATTALVQVQAHTQSVLGVKLGSLDVAPFRLVTCSGDQLVKVFDIRMIKPHNDGMVPSPSIVAAASTDRGRPRRIGGECHTLSLHSDAVFCLGMTADKLCTGSADGTIKLVRFDK